MLVRLYVKVVLQSVKAIKKIDSIPLYTSGSDVNTSPTRESSYITSTRQGWEGVDKSMINVFSTLTWAREIFRMIISIILRDNLLEILKSEYVQSKLANFGKCNFHLFH